MQEKLKISAALLIIIVSMAMPVWAESALINILKDGVGIRPLGMGGAFTAVADDPNSIFYNPAGLANFEMGYLKGFQDLNNTETKVNEYSMVASKPFGFAFWQKAFTNGDKPEVYCYTYAKEGPNRVSWGMNYKVIRNLNASSEVVGTSYDLGILGEFNSKLKWGVLFQDIIEDMGIPASVRTGIAYKAFPALLIATDVEFRNLKAKKGPDVNVMLGVENNITEGLILRAGFKHNRWTGGITAQLPYFVLEYALITSPPGIEEEVVQLFGIRIVPQKIE